MANLLDHRYQGNFLSDKQIEKAMEYLSDEPDILTDVLKYRAKSLPFKQYLFGVTIKPFEWWRSLNGLNPKTLNFVEQLHTSVASSAGL